MRKEFVYSVIALGAIPVMANAADVQTINPEVLTSVDGSEVSYVVGKLVPGKYKFKAQLTSKVYGVKVKIGGVEAPYAAKTSATDVDVEFTLTKETDITLTLVSTDPGEDGAGWTIASPVVSLEYNFTTIKTTLAGNAETLAATIGGYNYAAKQEDVDAANALKKKAQDVDESYDDYKKFKLYAEKSTIQEEIEALAKAAGEKEAAFQNEQAYNRVNAAITTIKGVYNTAVAELEQTLVGVAAYLLDDAKKDLNDNINVKITEATQASYASYKADTAVDDEATNMGKVPTKDAIDDIVDNWKGQATTNINAYNTLHGKVTTLQTNLQAVIDDIVKSDIPANYTAEKTAAENAIDAIDKKVEDAKNSAAKLTLNIDKDVTAAQTLIDGKPQGKYSFRYQVDEYNANVATTTAIKKLQDNLDAAKTAVKALKYGNVSVESYYTDYVADIQKDINDRTAAAKKAYETDHNAATFDVDADPVQAKIDTYAGTDKVDGMPKQAVDKYDDLQKAIADYEKKIGEARADIEALDVYEKTFKDNNDVEYGDYKTKLDLIQKRVNVIKKAITAAQGKVGAEHWTAMINIDADAAITADIATLLSTVQADQNLYDATQLETGITALGEKIGKFKVKNGDVLGADYAIFQTVETGIKTAYDKVVDDLDQINPNTETIDFTGLVGKTQGDWVGAEEMYGGNPAVNGNTDAGVKLSQTVVVKNGIYDVKVFAWSHNEWGGGPEGHKASLAGESTEVAHVFANDVSVKITARKNTWGEIHTDGPNAGYGQGGMKPGVEPESYTISGVKVTDGKITIGLAVDQADKAEWHGIQIESLTFNTKESIKDWNNQIAELNKQQTAIESAASDVAAKVTANTTAKTQLGTNIGNLQTAMGEFETTYKVGQDDSPLGLRGKAKGEVTVEVGDINAKLTTLEGNNTTVDVTAVADSLMTFKVGTAAANWGGIGFAETTNAPAVNEKQMVEAYDGSSCTQTGTVLSQTITGLENGIYNVVLCANAQAANGVDKEHAITADATDVAYVFVNGEKQWITAKVGGKVTANGEFEFANVIVSDGTLTLGLEKVKAGTNWHTIQIKSLTYRENASKLLPTYNKEYLELNKRKNALGEKAPKIVEEVNTNAATLTAAKNAITALQTTELNTLKSLANVTDANAESTDAVAKKADPEDWKVFKSGLEKGKSYTEKKAAIDADIDAMLQAVKDTAAAETLTAAWKNNSISVTKKVGEDDVTTTYSIATITTAINDLKTEAEAESKNYLAYKGLQDNNMSKLLPDTIFTKMDGENRVVMSDAEIEAIVGARAMPYYVGLKTKYITGKAGILTRMQADLNARKAVSTKDDFVTEITDSIAKVKVVKSDAIANKKRYDDQVKAYNETQTLWNATYTEIAATDKSSMVQKWLDELDGIQVTLTAATQAVEKNYPLGKSVAETQDFAAIKAKIEDVKARQSESYNEYVAADNAAHHATFIKQINAATEAYQKAVKARAMYSSTNAEIEAAVTTAAAKLDAALYSCPTDI